MTVVLLRHDQTPSGRSLWQIGNTLMFRSSCCSYELKQLRETSVYYCGLCGAGDTIDTYYHPEVDISWHKDIGRKGWNLEGWLEEWSGFVGTSLKIEYPY